MTTLRLALCLLIAAAAAAPGTGVPERAGEASAAAARVDARTVVVEGLELGVRISPTAHAFHLLDNLSGTSPGKTRGVWRREFTRRTGELTARDREVLARFRAARLYRGRAARRPDPDATTCLAPRAPGPALARQVSAAALGAASDAAFFARVDALLPAEHAASIRHAFEHFGPRLAPFRDEAARLEPFAGELVELLSRGRTRRLVRAMIRFFGAEIDGKVPITVSLIALPPSRGTHAEAGLHHLLLEIRPGDDAASQVPVVFHELAHDLAARVPHERREAFARSLLSRGAAGSLAWILAKEGLPTALGQGVAQQKLAPRGFDRSARWYHVRGIDLFAHRIFEDVRRELVKGRGMGERLPAALVEAVESTALARSPLAAFLGEPILSAPLDGLAALGRVERALTGARAVRARWDEADGVAFAVKHDCAPLVVAGTLDELARLPEALARQLPAVPAGLAESPSLAGALVTGRRPSGAPSLLLVAAGPESRGRVAAAVGRTTGWPSAPVFVPRAGQGGGTP